MEIFWGNDKIDAAKIQNPVVTIGNFDGCHIGHQEIFKRVKKHAAALHGSSVVYTFNPHPASVINNSEPNTIYTLNEKIEAISSLGMDFMVVVPFTREFADTHPERFVNDILVNGIRAKGVVVGYDFVFGRRAMGDIPFLKKKGEELGFFVESMPAVIRDGVIVSSTLIRTMIKSGDVCGAARLLSGPYRLPGTVVHGMARGRLLGFPTANIRPDKSLIPAYGVYATNIYLDGKCYTGATNIGDNPTFGDEGTSIEAFLFDFEGDLYNRHISIEFIDRLRKEIKFDSKDKLIRQIDKDCRNASEILNRFNSGHRK
ncbi:MAG TPA: bifunctional riboflavin kinase/FAD synthetase [Desulfomonilia bacterium]